MLDLAKLKYKVTALSLDGTVLDLTNITSNLGWEEGERELSARISLKLANIEYNGGRISDLIRPFTPIFIYASFGAQFQEVIRGTVAKWSLTETNTDTSLDIECYDEVYALRKNQDEFYFTEGHMSGAIITEVLGKWGVPLDYQGPAVKHAKKVFNRKYLCDIVTEVLKDAKELGGGTYFMRAQEGVVQIIPRGTNSPIYHFDLASNLIKTSEHFDAGDIVTRVLVVAKSNEEGHQKIESTIDGKTDYGVRQVIYERPDKTTLAEAETAARKILEEQGDIERKTSIESPDLPTLRKGDRIRVRSSAGLSYFFVKSIRHNAEAMRMTLELDEDKGYNLVQGLNYDTKFSDESGSSEPD